VQGAARLPGFLGAIGLFLGWATCAMLAQDMSPVPALVGDQAIPGERYRIRTDVDGDGIPDLILSDPLRLFGNGGGGWEVFLGKPDDTFSSAGRISAQVGFIRVERKDETSRMWVWFPGGAWVGALGYYEIRDGRIQPFASLTIYAGDGGTELGNAVFHAVFPEGFDAGLEISSTTGETVIWSKANLPAAPMSEAATRDSGDAAGR